MEEIVQINTRNYVSINFKIAIPRGTKILAVDNIFWCLVGTNFCNQARVNCQFCAPTFQQYKMHIHSKFASAEYC